MNLKCMYILITSLCPSALSRTIFTLVVLLLCVDHRGLRSGRHLDDDDDVVPELAHIHPRERPDWEETISAMVRRAHVGISWYERLVPDILASSLISLITRTDSLCCRTNFISVAASETLSRIVARANILWGLCRNSYPSYAPVFCCLFHHSPGDIIIFFSPVSGLVGPTFCINSAVKMRSSPW